MKVGVFDSGLGGLTVVSAINEVFKGAQLLYIADTAHAPYGIKSQEEILKRCIEVTNFLIKEHQIEALIVACNTATSAAIKHLRQKFPFLIVIGTEPGVKPAINSSITSCVGVLATPATLKGDKYQLLVDDLSKDKDVILLEQACAGLVEQIEKGEISHNTTIDMLKNWLEPMKKANVDTIVLGCTHYPLVSAIIKSIMGDDIKLIETGPAIANRLMDLSSKKGHQNEGLLEILVYHTGQLNKNMVDMIFKDYKENKNIDVRKCEI